MLPFLRLLPGDDVDDGDGDGDGAGEAAVNAMKKWRER
tara:strand:+ start:663 stop:776 length:114 start_codon:yes stop_codon:yes gene_type:complete